MRFRIVHLLTVIALCAVFAAALANPESYWWKTLIPIGAWLTYAVIACRAVSCRERRESMLGALIFGLSYLAMAFWWILPTNHVLNALLNFLGDSPRKGMHFGIIGHIAFSFVFALLGGALCAYWSRSQKDK